MIRPATEDDAEQILGLYLNSTNMGHSFEPAKYDVEDFRMYAGDERTILLVDQTCNILSGFVLAYNLLSWCYLDVLVVHHNFRRGGVAKELIWEVRRHCLPGIPIESCYYSDDNDIKQFLQKTGWEHNWVPTRWVKKR